ncbi:hypothetical protein HCN44_008860 [Aphidius gifuensis]|uniref:Uncharacterized protein n=1 Tax=Aphidius gifuensis TaxID=684658 RepID=A0A834Y6M2_APHGI|nr:protein PFC0760c-like [Aphidius gifuensis]XP_044001987.1 protein PFC0760c-like [Aphidius gifuensis]XP_044001997.1 protein PFC0760c-like [Aphidius gifuensis]KAF7997687.1 hypothetical protein HCN44_008860 [Aphidius gifuensis]
MHIKEKTSDMMEDAMSEDTIMDCEGDSSGSDDLVDRETDISNVALTIHGVAERLLNLLGVENSDDDDDNDDLLSSSEDEGVDLDDDNNEDDLNNSINTKLLHQLASSLTQELKLSQQKNSSSCNTEYSSQNLQDNENQNMELSHEVNNQNQNSDIKFDNNYYCSGLDDIKDNQISEYNNFVSNKRCRYEQNYRTDEPEEIPSSWDVGWDECTAEAVKYLTEVEGLSLQHPIVLALKSHLQVQRDMTCVQFT